MFEMEEVGKKIIFMYYSLSNAKSQEHYLVKCKWGMKEVDLTFVQHKHLLFK